MTAVHSGHFLIFIIAATFYRFFYYRCKILVITDMHQFWIWHNWSCENPVAVTLSYRHDTIGCKQNRCRNIMKLRLLILPACSEVAFKMRVFFQFRVSMCRKHFTVSINIYSLALCLFKKKFHIMKVMTAYYDKRPFFYGKRNCCRNRITISICICRIKHSHAFKIDFTRFHNKFKESIRRGIFTDKP